MMEVIHVMTTARRLRSRSVSQMVIAASAIAGGAIVISGTWMTWFSLYAGLQPYRGVDVLNGRLLAGWGVLSILTGVWFLRHSSKRLRWGIGFFGFAMLAFASWSLIQLLILYRELSTDAMMIARLGPGLMVVEFGAFLVFATFFLPDSRA